jgi:hypothetical protein
MTDIAHALASGSQGLTGFGGHDVIESKVEIPGAAGGLREAMKFAPIELDPDAEVTVVIRCRVKAVKFVKVRDTELLARVHVLEPISEGGAFIDDSLVSQIIARTQRETQKARDAAAGIQALDLGDEAGILADEDEEGEDEEGEDEDLDESEDEGEDE